jgi:chromate transporter
MSGENLPAYSLLPAWRRDVSLFWAYFKIAALVVGGGYAILAAARREFVTRKEWLTEDEIVEMMAVTQTVPGIIACNTAAYIGWKIDGFRGAAAAVLGAICPSFLIILLIASGMTFLADFFASPAVRGAFRAVTAAIAAMVAVTAMKMRKKTVTGPEGLAIALVCFFAITVIRLSPPYMIAFAVVFGIVFETCRRAKRIGEEKP